MLRGLRILSSRSLLAFPAVKRENNMAESLVFIVGVCGVLYVLRWLWLNDDGKEFYEKKPFSPDDRKR
jgi:hypothetical protein